MERVPRSRSRALDTLFLVAVVGGAVIYGFTHVGMTAELSPVWLFGTGMALIVVLWFCLSWERPTGWGRRLASVGFVVVTVVITIPSFGSGPLCALAVANLVFAWGVPAASGSVLMIVVAYVPIQLAGDGFTRYDAAFTGFIVLFYGSVVVFAEIVRRSRDDKRLTESLFAQLGRAHADLSRAHEELSERANRIRELTVNAERARFARDMHDSIGHHLTVVGMTLRTAQRMSAERQREAWANVERAQDLTSAALEETRRAVRALRPAPVGRGRIDDGLRTLAQRMHSPWLTVEFTCEGDCERIDDDVAAVIYRSAQEGVTNVVRHSAASVARMMLRVGTEVELSVSDGGPSKPPDGSAYVGSGLAGLRARAGELGGHVEAGAVGAGFVLLVRLPTAGRRPPSRP